LDPLNCLGLEISMVLVTTDARFGSLQKARFFKNEGFLALASCHISFPRDTHRSLYAPRFEGFPVWLLVPSTGQHKTQIHPHTQKFFFFFFFFLISMFFFCLGTCVLRSLSASFLRRFPMVAPSRTLITAALRGLLWGLETLA